MSKRLFIAILCVGLMSYSCTSSLPEIVGVDIKKHTQGNVKFRDICSEVRIIPLNDSIGCSMILNRHPKMSYANGYIYVLDDDGSRVFKYDADGNLLLSVEIPRSAVDFSVYKDKGIDVLVPGAYISFDVTDGHVVQKFNIKDTTVTLSCLARWSDNEINMLGYSLDGDYNASIDLSRGYYGYCKNPHPVPGPLAAEVVSGCRFFRYGEKVFLFYSDSGNIWVSMNFTSPKYLWDYSGKRNNQYKSITSFLSSQRYGTSYKFFNVQMTERTLYGVFLHDGKEKLFLFNRENDQYTIIEKTKEGLTLPVGVIEDDKNYFVCPSSDLNRYLCTSVLNEEQVSLLTSAQKNGGNVLLVYSLVKQ